MLDVIATAAGVVGTALSVAQVYYARLQVRHQAAPANAPEVDETAEHLLRFSRPWRPGWVQLFLGAALVGYAVKSFDYQPFLTDNDFAYPPPPAGLAAVILALGLVSAAPTIAYQASVSLVRFRLIPTTVVFLVGALGGYWVPENGFQLLSLLTVATVLFSAVAYGLKTQPAWLTIWSGLEADHRKRGAPHAESAQEDESRRDSAHRESDQQSK